MPKTKRSVSKQCKRRFKDDQRVIWFDGEYYASAKVLWEHPHSKDLYRVRTVAGEHYAWNFELHKSMRHLKGKTSDEVGLLLGEHKP